MEVTIKLLENAMRAQLEGRTGGAGWDEGHGRFLIDGFPRKMDQALKFEEDVYVPLLICLGSIDLTFFSRSVYRLSPFSLQPQKRSCSTVCWSVERPAGAKMTTLRVS